MWPAAIFLIVLVLIVVMIVCVPVSGVARLGLMLRRGTVAQAAQESGAGQVMVKTALNEGAGVSP